MKDKPPAARTYGKLCGNVQHDVEARVLKDQKHHVDYLFPSKSIRVLRGSLQERNGSLRSRPQGRHPIRPP